MKLTAYRKSLPAVIKREHLVKSLEYAELAFGSVKATSRNVQKIFNRSKKTGNVTIDRRDDEMMRRFKATPLNYLLKHTDAYVRNLSILKTRVNEMPVEVSTKVATIDILTIIALVHGYNVTTGWMVDYISEKTKAIYLSTHNDGMIKDELAPMRSVLRRMTENSTVVAWTLEHATVTESVFKDYFSNDKAIFVDGPSESEMDASGRLNNNPVKGAHSNGFLGNPFYVIGSYFASWSAHSHKLVSEELQQVQLMLSEIEKGGDLENPQVQREIMLLNSRIEEKRQLLKDLAD